MKKNKDGKRAKARHEASRTASLAASTNSTKRVDAGYVTASIEEAPTYALLAHVMSKSA